MCHHRLILALSASQNDDFWCEAAMPKCVRACYVAYGRHACVMEKPLHAVSNLDYAHDGVTFINLVDSCCTT